MADRTCSTPGCDTPAHSLGLCMRCYRRHARAGDLDTVALPRYDTPDHTCDVDGCDEPARRSMCEAHRWRLRHWEDVRADVPIKRRTSDVA